MDELEVRAIAVAATIDLRSRVLRDHLPGAPATAPSDTSPGAWHLGAFRGGRLVGVVSGFAAAAPGRPDLPAQRFRFMAVEPAEQGRGVGTVLIGAVIDQARARGDRLLWANGRDSALDFYARLGFAVIGESFDDATSQLPHHLVILELDRRPGSEPAGSG